jgi:hypothetical protein
MRMSDEPSNTSGLGNVILGSAAVLLLFIGKAWEVMGAGAMVLWMGLVGLGVYFITQGKQGT